MKSEKHPAVYMMANVRNGTLYVGVTSDIVKRVSEHKTGIHEGFTKKYGCKTLVYYEPCGDMEHAIEREKQIKGGSRKKKIELIEKTNPQWQDLFETLL